MELGNIKRQLEKARALTLEADKILETQS